MRALLSSKAFHSFLGFFVSLGLILWICTTVEWSEVAHELVHINYLYLIPATLVLIVHYLIRAWRWRYLLPSDHPVRVRTLFDAIMVGAFATFILPLRAGEFVRPFLLSKQSKHSFVTGFVSVVVERFFDLSVVLLSFGLMTMFVPQIPNWVQHGASLLSVLAVIILLVMVLGSFSPQAVEKIAQMVFRFFPSGLRKKLMQFTRDFLAGSAVLSKGKNLLWIVLLSFLVWASCYVLFFVGFWICHIEAGFLVAVTVSVIVALAVAAPSAPGFIGVFQTATIASFALFGMRRELAVAYSIVMHLFQYVIFVLYGMYVLVHYNLKFSQLQKVDPPSS